jgi:hypothetical protein
MEEWTPLQWGDIKVFTDIGAAPRGAVVFLPKRVLRQVLRFPGVETLSGVPGFDGGDRNVVINTPHIDPVLYSLTATALLDYTRRHRPHAWLRTRNDSRQAMAFGRHHSSHVLR